MEGEELGGSEGGAGEEGFWKNIRTSILSGFAGVVAGVEGGGVDEVDADAEVEVEAAAGFEMEDLPFT
jgi:hypothetical protein